ncbi:hypothetical protein GCM10009799_33850 [Nocardiopsis rhodophaea]|uniref:Uncharacterized protein n=1 Tax=Nocardiopsis rhodophaea TaxID=280238 RepID=A0ABP5ESA0_9ACTN
MALLPTNQDHSTFRYSASARSTFSEDASRVRSGHGPQNMAMLRNLAIPLLAKVGAASIPEAVRWVPYETFARPLELLRIP